MGIDEKNIEITAVEVNVSAMRNKVTEFAASGEYIKAAQATDIAERGLTRIRFPSEALTDAAKAEVPQGSTIPDNDAMLEKLKLAMTGQGLRVLEIENASGTVTIMVNNTETEVRGALKLPPSLQKLGASLKSMPNSEKAVPFSEPASQKLFLGPNFLPDGVTGGHEASIPGVSNVGGGKGSLYTGV